MKTNVKILWAQDHTKTPKTIKVFLVFFIKIKGFDKLFSKIKNKKYLNKLFSKIIFEFWFYKNIINSIYIILIKFDLSLIKDEIICN